MTNVKPVTAEAVEETAVHADPIRSRMTSLKNRKSAMHILKLGIIVLIGVGIVLSILAVKTSDIPVLIGRALTPDEARLQDILLLLGVAGLFLGGILLAFCESINAWIDSELANCRSIRRAKSYGEKSTRTAIQADLPGQEPTETQM